MSPPSTPEGPGSVSGAPNLPTGFTDTFASRYIDTGFLRQHAVIGGRSWLAAELVRLAAGDARAGPGVRGHRP